MKFHSRSIILLFFISFPIFPLFSSDSDDTADKPLKSFSIGVIGAYHLETSYIDPAGNTYTDPGHIDQQKYFGLSFRLFFLKNLGIGFNALILDATDTIYEFGTLFLGDLNLLYRYPLLNRVVLNAGVGISRLYLYIKDKAEQRNSLEKGDISYNATIGVEIFPFRCFSIGLNWIIRQYADHNNFKTRMQSLMLGAFFWI